MRDQHGEVRAMPVGRTDAATLVRFVKDNAPEGATVVTDEFKAYRSLPKHGFDHKTVRHSAGEYVRDMAHTNGIESFWSLLKRGYIGVYHYMSEDHLHRYINEFSFCHNTSKIGTVAFINMTIDRMVDKRLTYKDLING
jgi:transposase-like protein